VAPLARYQQQKTGALFVAAVAGGAIAAGADPALWRAFAARLGEAYQVADDIRDVVATREDLGKPTGQDAVHARPSWVGALGVPGACRRFDALMEAALEAIPPVAGATQLRALLRREAQRLLPAEWAREAA
jgi:geranylgeranyl diphosphate synthase type II